MAEQAPGAKTWQVLCLDQGDSKMNAAWTSVVLALKVKLKCGRRGAAGDQKPSSKASNED